MAVFSGEEERRGEWLRGAEIEAISEGVDAKSWIFFDGRVIRSLRSNGGLSRPSLGMRSFWEAGGMESFAWISEERSMMVDVAGRWNM